MKERLEATKGGLQKKYVVEINGQVVSDFADWMFEEDETDDRVLRVVIKKVVTQSQEIEAALTKEMTMNEQRHVENPEEETKAFVTKGSPSDTANDFAKLTIKRQQRNASTVAKMNLAENRHGVTIVNDFMP